MYYIYDLDRSSPLHFSSTVGYWISVVTSLSEFVTWCSVLFSDWLLPVSVVVMLKFCSFACHDKLYFAVAGRVSRFAVRNKSRWLNVAFVFCYCSWTRRWLHCRWTGFLANWRLTFAACSPWSTARRSTTLWRSESRSRSCCSWLHSTTKTNRFYRETFVQTFAVSYPWLQAYFRLSLLFL